MKDSFLHSDPGTWFHQRGTAYVSTQLLFHLNRLGVFEFLMATDHPQSVESIAKELGLAQAPLQTVLEYVAAVENLVLETETGTFSLSSFGKKCIQRFGRFQDGKWNINFFDVRVGAYGPVWSQVDVLLKGEPYGKTVHRRGTDAADAVFKLAEKFLPSLEENISFCDANAVIEIGINSGLLEALAVRKPNLRLKGLDRSGEAIEKGKKTLSEAEWLHADIFNVETWAQRLKPSDKTLFFSLHLHELFSAGEDAVVSLLVALKSKLPGSRFLWFEQPRLDPRQRESMNEMLWLYAQSNVLIHHLIGNGQILSEEKLIALFKGAGCKVIHVKDTGYLGYKAFLIEV